MNATQVTIALAGNPNSGKTTLFNAITGSQQHVGNYPGVTVEKKQGSRRHDGVDIKVVDLPGTYSLTAYSVEEVVARNFILEENPHVVVDIIDSSNLERNLYLATQLLELGVPLVLAFNMSDVARSRGYAISTPRLSKLLGVPIVRTVGHRSTGVDRLMDAVVAVARDGQAALDRQRAPDYGSELEPHVEQLTARVAECAPLARHSRWFAIKLLEGDEVTAKRIRQLCPERADELLAEADHLRRHIEGLFGDAAEIILADRRYGFISGACTESVKQTIETRHERSDRIDSVLLNRWVGLPIFLVLMYMVFQLTFWVGTPLVEFLDAGKESLAEGIRLMSAGQPGPLVSLLADGIVEGVGAVVVFVPLILLLFLGIAVLEDSGYMARAAFLLDRMMHRIGLHGKSFIPMLIGFGCTVPGIMATRTLETRRDRLTTILILPLMSCGARLPVYAMIIGPLFASQTLFYVGPLEVNSQGLWLLGIYLIGIVLAIIAAKVLRKTVLRGEITPLVMELPPYRMPTLKGLAVHTLQPAWYYLRKAGTIILAIVVVLWAMKTYPQLPQDQQAGFDARREALLASEPTPDKQGLLHEIELQRRRAGLQHSAIGQVGRFIAPTMAPCGFDWKISTALLGSLAAKEVFVGQMGMIYAVDTDDEASSTTLSKHLASNYTPLQGLSIMLFILIASPCIATVAVTVREAGSWKWAAFMWSYLTLLAWVVSTVVYQGGRLIAAWQAG